MKSFISQFNAEFGLEIQGLDQEAWDIIRRYEWPGNVRELRNVVESSFNVVAGPVIKREHLPDQLSQLFPRVGAQTGNVPGEGIQDYIRSVLGKKDFNQIMDDFEKVLVETAVESSHGNKFQAAQLLGISRQWLYKKLHKHSEEQGDTD